MKNLIHAGRGIAGDLLSTLIFAALVAMKVDVAICVAASVAIGVGQIAFMLATRRPVAPLQWASLALVLLFAAASLLTHDVRFLMAKPTLVYVIIGVVMLKRGWMLRYLPPIASVHGERPMIVFGYIWSGLMFATAIGNLAVAYWAPQAWPLFLATFPTASKVVLFAIQFATVRAIAVRGIRAEMAAQAA